jgi:transmembrane sensor
MVVVAKRNEIDAAASRWAVRLDAGDLSHGEQAALDAWLVADPRHEGALARAEAIWLDLDRVSALERAAPERARPRNPGFTHWRLAATLAVSIATASISGAAAYDRLAGREATSIGEIRHIVLDYRGRVEDQAGAVVQVRYQRGERRVIVRRGAAAFQVAAGDPRPFVVKARNLSLDAAGANFAVDVGPGDVAVNVADGRVKAARRTSGGAFETCYLGRSRRLVAEADIPLRPSKISDAEMTRELAWRRGVLMFDGERLADAVQQLNRYSRTPILIEDPALGDRTFVGVFQVGDSRAFAQAAATTFDARVVEENGALRLSRD